MTGAIAAGHPLTAEAGQRMFALGGNAFDAALAALCAASVVEPVLTSLGGGGFLLARATGRAPILYDFFVQTPRRRRATDDVDFRPVIADFGTAQQEFHIGSGAIATPGTVRGLLHCQRALGSLPLREIVAPAVEYARAGVEVNALQAYIFSIVEPIYRATPAAESIYGGAALAGQGSLFRQPELAETLAWIGDEGDAPFYDGEIAARLVTLSAEAGGHLTRDDLAAYRVIARTPLEHRYHGWRVATNPPPSSGGTLINYALSMLDGQALHGLEFGSIEHLHTLAHVMTHTNVARGDGLLARTEQHRRLMEAYRAAVRGHPLNTRGTTHISSIDAHGNAASLTLSNGEGSGCILPGTGVMLNNMLGEEDLNPHGFNRWPCDVRVSSMMAPTLAEDDRCLIAIGSGGSNRLRTAIVQTLSNLIDFGMSPDEAVNAPRIHFERGQLDVEPGFDDAAIDSLTARYPENRLWNSHNLFFGGTHTVCWDGRTFSGAGDPRRGGVFLAPRRTADR
ncbi:MAG: gamma-glutamyltransferase [Gammaproteobacteria bacterium]|nr:gamma-glutamyltransferase [Gammaproteobacteria bacterium]MCP5298384.1 gamma-glutamyltransferase [Chromatiaceae bacterium]